MSLKDVDIKEFYSGNDDLIEDFYLPCLDGSVHYDRVAEYFSSGIFNLLKMAEKYV